MTKFHPVALWLYGVAALVFTMIIVGAITRLTESGLSMVEWRPLIGALPPLNDAEWQRVFELYQQSPEYQKVNFWMGIEDFKHIFFWEWLHRLLGRLIGATFALPFAFFWLTKRIPEGFKLKLFGLFLLGGLQGFMGWFMVKSGLVDIPAVSHYRLAAHLGLAFLILSALIWVARSLQHAQRAPSAALYHHTLIVLIFLVTTICWGAFVAGLDAGLIYNQYPQMGDTLVPPDLWTHEIWYLNFLDNRAGVQFFHRWVAALTVLMLLNLSIHGLTKDKSPFFWMLGVMALTQMGLGIATILSQVQLPIAVMHQAGAVILLLILMMILQRTQPAKDA